MYLSDWWKSPPIPPHPILQDQFSYWRRELDFFQLLWHENCQLSLNHGVITGSEKQEREEIRLAFQMLDWLQRHVLVTVGVGMGDEGGDGENKNIVFSLIKKTTIFMILIHAEFLLSFLCFPVQNNWKQSSEGKRMENHRGGGVAVLEEHSSKC